MNETVAAIILFCLLAGIIFVASLGLTSERPIGLPSGPPPPAPPRNKGIPTNNPGTGTPPSLRVRIVDISTMCDPHRFLILRPGERIGRYPAKPRGCPFDEQLPPPPPAS